MARTTLRARLERPLTYLKGLLLRQRAFAFLHDSFLQSPTGAAFHASMAAKTSSLRWNYSIPGLIRIEGRDHFLADAFDEMK
jgi:hypothetical protein